MSDAPPAFDPHDLTYAVPPILDGKLLVVIFERLMAGTRRVNLAPAHSLPVSPALTTRAHPLPSIPPRPLSQQATRKAVLLTLARAKLTRTQMQTFPLSKSRTLPMSPVTIATQ